MLATGALVLGVLGTIEGAGGLPSQASPTAEDAIQTHGPDGLDLDARGRGRPGAAALNYDVDAHAPWQASQWDGAAFTTDQPDTASGPQFHAIYMHPSGTASRFGTYAAMFQADARDASARLASTRGRALRWDTRADGYIDITVVKSSYNAKRLGSGSQFSLVRNELVNKGFNDPNKKYVVWLDAGSTACGQGELYQDTRRSTTDNYNQRRTTAIVYRPYPNDASTGGFCRGRTALHEMGHNMGALQKVAPNAFDGAHCDDSGEDVMCYTSATSADTGDAVFDHNNDDYWDPTTGAPLAWWTVNLSKYVCAGNPC